MKEATFTLEGYSFPSVKLNLSNVKSGRNHFNLNISPEGVFSVRERSFLLTFNFVASLENDECTPCIEITCVGKFAFKEVESVVDIPQYFYANSIAILFPYVRAFVSTVTLQANYQPIVLPTMNLADLSGVLKEHVVVVD